MYPVQQVGLHNNKGRFLPATGAVTWIQVSDIDDQTFQVRKSAIVLIFQCAAENLRQPVLTQPPLLFQLTLRSSALFNGLGKLFARNLAPLPRMFAVFGISSSTFEKGSLHGITFSDTKPRILICPSRKFAGNILKRDHQTSAKQAGSRTLSKPVPCAAYRAQGWREFTSRPAHQ